MATRPQSESDPAALVLAFIADFHQWNAAANARQSAAGRKEANVLAAMDAAVREYRLLLAKYCPPGFAGEPVSYGIPPLHDPATESITAVSPRGDTCVVKTTNKVVVGGLSMPQDFEYRLTRTGDRWHLTGVKCVVGGRKHECLSCDGRHSGASSQGVNCSRRTEPDRHPDLRIDSGVESRRPLFISIRNSGVRVLQECESGVVGILP